MSINNPSMELLAPVEIEKNFKRESNLAAHIGNHKNIHML